MFRVFRDVPSAILPIRTVEGSAGYDLSSVERVVIPARNRAVVSTGLRISIPEDCYARVAPRSGLAVKKGIDVGAGVVDSGYTGVVGVVLFNFGSEEFVVEIGDRIAQLILERIYTPEWVEVDTVTQLSETTLSKRGDNGFGSSGV
jgi:dUTP pyrophosphatase